MNKKARTEPGQGYLEFAVATIPLVLIEESVVRACCCATFEALTTTVEFPSEKVDEAVCKVGTTVGVEGADVVAVDVSTAAEEGAAAAEEEGEDVLFAPSLLIVVTAVVAATELEELVVPAFDGMICVDST